MDDNIVSVANYFNKKHIYMYAKGLNFMYYPKIKEGESVLKFTRTCCTYPTSFDKLSTELFYLQYFVGLKIDVISTSNLTRLELINFIKKNIRDNIPIGISLDTYYTPWYDKYYQKIHMPHSFLAIDINVKEEYLLCVDGFLSDKPVKLPFENLFLSTGVITFRNIPSKINTSFHNIISQVVNGLKDSNKLDNCDGIRLFSRDVKKISFSNEEKIFYEDLNSSQFMFGLKSIEYGRKNIADMFHYMSNEFPDQSNNLLSLQSKVNTVTEQWKLLIVFFIKGFYSNRTSYYMNKVAELLLMIANNEEDVVSSLIALM